MANRSMLAKVERAKRERMDAGAAEYSKPFYKIIHSSELPTRPVPASEKWTAREVRVIEAHKTMRQVLRSHF
jgi:hypothetical protein